MILGKFKKVIKHLWGRPQYVTPIIDKTKYPSILGSAGGSLYASNVLVVTNIPQLDAIRKLFEKEQCNLFCHSTGFGFDEREDFCLYGENAWKV